MTIGRVGVRVCSHTKLKKINRRQIKKPLSHIWLCGLITKTNSPLGQLVIESKNQITLDSDLTKLFGVQRLLLETAIKRVITTTAYFIHCDLIDKTNNLFNNKRTDLLAKLDVKGKPYEKVSYVCSSEQPFRDCSTDSHVNSITLSVRDQDGELFDFQGLPIEFELELN